MSSQKWPTMSWHLVTAGIFTSSHCSRNWLKGPLQRENQFLWTYPWCSVNMFPLITSIEPLVHGKLLKNDVSWISRRRCYENNGWREAARRAFNVLLLFWLWSNFHTLKTQREREGERERRKRERERRKREIDLFLWILSRILLTE